MASVKLSRRYAKSLLELAVETDNLDAVHADMLLIKSTTSASKELQTLLKSPVVKADKKINILVEIFGQDICELSSKFLALMTNKGREADLLVIAESFEDLYREKQNIKKAIVTTAEELNDSQRAAINSKLEQVYTGMSIEMEEKLDPEMIGGITLRVDNRQYNGSLAAKLDRLRREFKDNQYTPEF